MNLLCLYAYYKHEGLSHKTSVISCMYTRLDVVECSSVDDGVITEEREKEREMECVCVN